MNIEEKKIGRIILLIMIFVTICFAFYQSMLPPEQSSAESGAVGDIIEEIIPPETPVGGFVQINLRKIAHFVEFAALGAEVALYVSLYRRKLSFALLTYPFGMIVAFFDESIQMFTERGPQISDVWIDFSGFLSFSLLVYALFFLSLFIYKKIKMKVSIKNGQNN